jgi:hypothetical protein
MLEVARPIGRGVRFDPDHVSRWYRQGQTRISALRTVSLEIHPGGPRRRRGSIWVGKDPLAAVDGAIGSSV